MMATRERAWLFKPNSAANRFRHARVARFRRMVEAVLAARGSCSILDVGGTVRYWQTYGADLLDDTRIRLVTLNTDQPSAERDAAHAAGIEARIGDACAMPDIAAHAFDIVHSNSVIEHVGPWPRMVAMAQEVRRVGRQHFVQTPYWGFPQEPHFRAPFLHWLPEQWRYRLLMTFPLDTRGRLPDVDTAMRRVQEITMLDRRQFGALFPTSSIHGEMFLGLTKSLVAIGGEGLPRHADSNRRRLRL